MMQGHTFVALCLVAVARGMGSIEETGTSRRLLQTPTGAPTIIPTPGPTSVAPAQRSTQTMGKMDTETSFSMEAEEGMLSITSLSSSVTEGPPLTVPLCGNGIRQGQEQCDDGNLVDGDGCSKICLVEPGFACGLKQVTDSSDRCWLCKDDECTVFHHGASHCLKTTASKTPKTDVKDHKIQASPLHVRSISGFCKCTENYCIDIDGAKCRPEGKGWVANYKTNQCECGLGYCLMPMATGIAKSPSKYHCMKMGPAMVRNAATQLCECAKEEPAVESSDPAKARPELTEACKVYPSTPVAFLGDQGPLYPEFSCQRAPYVKSSTSEACTDCEEEACRMPRPGVSGNSDNLGAIAPNQFYCVDSKAMEMLQMTRAGDGSCACKESECLVPYRDTMKCVPIKGSHPFGGVKLSDGKCGCAHDDNACIMPTKPGGYHSSGNGFTCLKLRDMGTQSSGKLTSHGENYYRGKSGYCRCRPTKCRADPAPSSIGTFRCIDVEKEGGYSIDKTAAATIKKGLATPTTEDVPCACHQGACMLPGDSRTLQQCVACPTVPGQCVARCSKDSADVVSCIKYCSSEQVKITPAEGMNFEDMFHKRNYESRIVRCFTSKTITCSVGATGTKSCTQKITARAVFDCPGVYSKRETRMLIDGSPTDGFKSVCEASDFNCQKEKCNSVANPAICLKGMILT